MDQDTPLAAPSEVGVSITAIPVHASHVVTDAAGKVGFVLPQPSAIAVALASVAAYIKGNYPVIVAALLGAVAAYVVLKL